MFVTFLSSVLLSNSTINDQRYYYNWYKQTPLYLLLNQLKQVSLLAYYHQSYIMLKHITLSMAGQLGLVLRVGGVLLGVGIVGDALGSGIIDMEESVQETPVGYSKYNNYVRAK